MKLLCLFLLPAATLVGAAEKPEQPNILFILSSDQSFHLGEKGWHDKRWMFEESLAMPFLIRWPGVVKPGIRPGALIQNIDYAPTFLEAAGLEIPADIQGRSLVPILRNEGKTPEHTLRDEARENLVRFPHG
jgi:arylsulfatase A-like enzyme